MPLPSPSPSSLPLSGLRVVALEQAVAAPFCSRQLADMGADVVKIERPGEGDLARWSMGNIYLNGHGISYLTLNRNKRSIALDLKSAGGRDAFLALAARADVVVESFRPGVVDALGVGYDAVRPVREAVVYASITGYGQTGPRAAFAGHDINYLGYAGVLDQTGTRGGPPALSNLQVADLLGGALTAAGTGLSGDDTRFSQASALSGASDVSRVNLLDRTTISRDSRRDALSDAADADLVDQAESQLKQRDAALAKFAQQAEQQAAQGGAMGSQVQQMPRGPL